MLQQDEPDDFVIATGQTRSIRELLEVAFGHMDMNWADHVEIDPKYYRPSEVDLLLGDPTKAREKLGWVPRTSFEDLNSSHGRPRCKGRAARTPRERVSWWIVISFTFLLRSVSALPRKIIARNHRGSATT